MSDVLKTQRLSRRRLVYGAASLAAFSVVQGCGYSPDPDGSLPYDAGPASSAGSTAHGTFTVTNGSNGVIPPGFMGLSYEKFAISYGYFHFSNHNLIALFRLLGTGVLRLGGGSVDQVLFTPDSEGATHAQVSPANIKALAAFLQQTGWQCLYGINLATSTPALAAQEVAYAVEVLGSSLLGIEIGNESDDYGLPGSYFAGNWTFADFMERWSLFRDAILEAAPLVPVTGPATGGGNHITSWTLAFGQALSASELTLLTQHYYRGSGSSTIATASFLIGPDPTLTAELALLNAGAVGLGIPYRISECNSFGNGGAGGVSNSYASSLWVIDFLFNAALGGATGINMHGGGDAPGYTPIADHSGQVLAARPEYYGLLLFSLAGAGALLQTELEVGTVDATAYAVKQSGGGVNVMVVNKDTLQDLTLTIKTKQPMQTANQRMMTGPGLAALDGVTIQGATVNPDGSFSPGSPETLAVEGSQTTCHVPALSAALIYIR